jgi:predicted  nucleic acid-binding Zn-ribbon protein
MATTTEEALSVLRELQTLDDKLTELAASRAALGKRVDDKKAHLADAESRLEQKQAEKKTKEKEAAKKELDIRVLSEKIAKLKVQLNTLDSNKQYAAMMSEISGFEAENSRAEDAAIIVMDQVEAVVAEVEATENEIVAAREAVTAEEADVAEDVAAVTREIEGFAAKREELIGRLGSDVAAKYERIRHGRAGKAVVAVIGGVCQGCFMGVTRQAVGKLWAQKELMYCPNCARIIYLEGDVQ